LQRAGAGKPGWTAGADGNRAKADLRATDIMPIIEDIRASGVTSLKGIARVLNERGILTARGGIWQATSVSRLLARTQ